MRVYQKQTEVKISVYFGRHYYCRLNTVLCNIINVYRHLITLTMSPVLSNYALRIYLKRAPYIKE